MGTMMYETPCYEFIRSTESTNRSEEILKLIAMGDYEGISLLEYLQMSFLTLVDGEEQHLDTRIMYGGNVYGMHACTSGVSPNQPVKAIKETQ